MGAYLDLIYDLQTIMDFPNGYNISNYSQFEKKLYYLPYNPKHRGIEDYTLKYKKSHRKVRYPGTPKQRRGIRRDFSTFLSYLKYPHEYRKEKYKVYRVLRGLFIYYHIARKNCILFRVERNRILNLLDEYEAEIEQGKISNKKIYDLLTQSKDIIYRDRKGINKESIKNNLIVKDLKNLLEDKRTLHYIKKIEQLIEENKK